MKITVKLRAQLMPGSGVRLTPTEAGTQIASSVDTSALEDRIAAIEASYVVSVAGKTGEVTLEAADLSDVTAVEAATCPSGTVNVLTV